MFQPLDMDKLKEKRKAGISSDEMLCKIAKLLDVSGLFLLDMENSQYIEKSSLKIIVKLKKSPNIVSV